MEMWSHIISALDVVAHLSGTTERGGTAAKPETESADDRALSTSVRTNNEVYE